MRERWIDNAKGIAILLVITGHVSTELKGFWNFGFVYGIHLVMFFLLSGYTLKERKINRKFVNQKFNRLMLPYFYTCAAIIITDVFNSCYLEHDCSINTVTCLLGKDLLRSFFASGSYKTFGTIDLGIRIGAIWFLPAMFFAIMIFQTLLAHTNDGRYLGISSGAIALAGYLSGRFLWLPFSLQAGMMACFFLWIGYEIKKQNLLDHLQWYHYVAAQFILLFGIFNHYCNVAFVTADLADLFLSIVVGLAGCFLIYGISKILRGGVLESIGKISLTVLCTHLYALETMRKYFNKILDRTYLKGNSRVWVFIFLEVLFALGIAFAIEKIKKCFFPIYKKLREKSQRKYLDIHKDRNTAIDVVKGIFILSMLVGHFKINSMLRSTIYSCHMAAFVYFSGYFYKKSSSIWKAVKHMASTFIIPYAIFVACVILIDYQNVNTAYLKELLIKYLLGISFSKKVFPEVPSVGPVYFILMLFVIRFLYLLVDYYIEKEQHKAIVVLCISVGGMLLGKEGFWLPWSADVACYALIFYYLGLCSKKYDLLSKVKGNHIYYFVLTLLWVYMIYMGSMEIAIRNYGQYGLMILGSVAGILSVYKLSAYISETLPITKNLLRLTGESSMIIIFVHTLLGEKIQKLVSCRFDREYMPYLISVVLLQIILSWGIRKGVDRFKYWVYN